MENHYKSSSIYSDNQVLNCYLFIIFKGVDNTERWKDIEGYEGYYMVSDFGRIKNTKTNHLSSLSDINSVGYKRVTLYVPIRKRFFVHRLVAYHFCDGYQEGLVVNHKDGNKQNNNYLNLEWVTRSKNDLHAFANNLRTITGGAIKQKEKAKRRVLIKTLDTDEIVYTFNTCKECAEYFKMNETYIQQCCRGLYKFKRKYKACYEEIA